MDASSAPTPDFSLSAAAASSTAAQIVCPTSVIDSAISSRNADSWDEHVPSVQSTVGSKLRLMCSYGGHIVPRPLDKSLLYVGGDTRMVLADRHSSLADLSSRLSKTLLAGRSFTLKYQLPNEDLDSLISVSTDEDLENMIDEYDRTSSSNKLSRIRLFLFPSKPDSASSISSLLDNSTKSEDWFLNALNGAGVFSRASSGSQSGNCLVSLDNDARGGKVGQDVHSIPDSPMLETTSSFGSTSSSQSMANLPSLRGGHLAEDQRLGLEEQFSQMNLAPASVQRQDEVSIAVSSPPQAPSSFVTVAAIPPQVPSSFVTVAAVPVGLPPVAVDYSSAKVVSDDERPDHGLPGGYLNPLQPLPQPPLPPQAQVVQFQQTPSAGGGSVGIDLPSPDSVSSDSSFTNAVSRSKPTLYHQDPALSQMHSLPNRVDPKMNIYDPNARVPIPQQSQDPPPPPPPGYILAPRFDQQHHHQKQQQQFVQFRPHYFQHQQSGPPVQIPSYYHPLYPSHQPQMDHHQQQYQPLYFVQSRPGEGPLPSESSASATPINRASAPPPKPEMAAAGMYRTTMPQPMIQMPSSGGQQQQYMGFPPHLQHASQSWSPAGVETYGYEFADPPPSITQMYYSQAPQYQTMTTAPTAAVLSESGSRIHAEHMMPQTKTSQP